MNFIGDKPTSHAEIVEWLRDQPELVHAGFFEDPLIEAAKRYYNSTEWRAMRRYLPKPPGLVLDIGAGRGITSYAFTKDGWNTVALEPSDSEIFGAGAIRSLAVETGLNIRIEECCGESMPFGDETFDIVHCREVLHHARNLIKLCSEAGRVLKKGGFFIATREHVISRHKDLNKFFASHPTHSLCASEYAYMLREYISAITGAGIKVKHILNPLQSDINLFPETVEGLKVRLAKKIMFPWPRLIPDLFLTILGSVYKTPGCLYTFIGEKCL